MSNPRTTTHRVIWKIDVEADSPYEATLAVWRDYFGDRLLTPDSACVFQVATVDESGDDSTGVRIDLAEPYAE